MEGIFALIDAIIEEHKQIREGIETSENIANDLGAILELGRATGDFEPATLDRKRRGLEGLQQSLEKVDKGLQAHFDREERALLTAFEDYGGRTFASALRALLVEHPELKNRIAKSKQDAAELAVGELSREVWEGKAYGMRVYISHTRKLLEAHAQSEQELLQTLRKELGEHRRE